MYGIEIKVGGTWRAVHMPNGPPYSFAEKAEAETMARILYPSGVGDPERVRISEPRVCPVCEDSACEIKSERCGK